MKTLVALLFSLSFAAVVSAEPALEEIVKRREEILSQLVEYAKKRHKGGTCSSEEVRQATLQLYAFRRDAAKTAPDRIKWQEMIVEVETENVRENERRLENGTTAPVSALLAEDRLLAAQQKLAELRQTK